MFMNGNTVYAIGKLIKKHKVTLYKSKVEMPVSKLKNSICLAPPTEHSLVLHAKSGRVVSRVLFCQVLVRQPPGITA